MNQGRAFGALQPQRPPSSSGQRSYSRQIATLGFVSEELPSTLLSRQLAAAVFAESKQQTPVVLVRFQKASLESSDEQKAAIPELYLNGEFHLPAELVPTPGGFPTVTITIKGEDRPSPAGLDSLVSQLSRLFKHVLIEVGINLPVEPWVFDLFERSDVAYLFLKPTTEDIYHLDQVTRSAKAASARMPWLKPIACLAAGHNLDGLDSMAQLVGSPIHLFVHDCPSQEEVRGLTDAGVDPATGRFNVDIRRLAREIGGRLTGLALSSGAAKGFAHVGVIQVLEENGIEIDVVAGSSMGAYVGSLWAYGCDGCELERLSREMESRWAFWKMISPVFPPRRGFLRGTSVRKRLMQSIGDVRFADLVRPLRVVAANLATLERKVFSTGHVATAVQASTAVPGIFVPITMDDGGTYIDGGIVDPLPVDVLREMGVARVIAVDVIPTPDLIRGGLEAERALALQNPKTSRRFKKAANPIEQHLNYFAPGNLLEILMRSLHGAQIRVAEASCLLADLVLHPDICDDRWLDYRNPGKFIALGREVAERRLEDIKALTNGTEVEHERGFTQESMAAGI
jgi:NTE family protein